jgi:hypothetical protein
MDGFSGLDSNPIQLPVIPTHTSDSPAKTQYPATIVIPVRLGFGKAVASHRSIRQQRVYQREQLWHYRAPI